MESKLSKFCDGVIESGWIAAILITPIFFNILSSRIFEPDKVSILRTITLIMLGAWLIKLADQGGVQFGKSWNSIRSVPLLLPVLVLALIYSVSTILSITPRISFFGSYPRLQGTYTFFSYIIIFISIISGLRNRQQLERLLTAFFLASLPVALYGILQRYGLDPIPWGGNVQNRISANMGNSIFLAAYLIMVIPVGIGKIIQVFQQILREDIHVLENILRATIYIFILLLNFIAIYMSGSRGPVLGLITGIFLLFVFLSIYWRKRWILVTTLMTASVIGFGLIVLNIPGGPLTGIRESPWLGRFGNLVDMEQRTSQVRTLIWQGAAELVSIHSPIDFPDGSQDYLNTLRPLIGYGPESMYVAYNRFFPPELGQIEKRNASPDRSHNESWDALVTTGLIGFLLYQLVFVSCFYYGFNWLGILITKKQKVMYLAFVLGGGILGGVIFSLLLGSGFLGVGIPFGLIFGLVLYVTVVSVIEKSFWQNDRAANPYFLVLIVLLATLAAHYVEIHFGIAIVSTRTLFWVVLGILIVVGSKFGEFGSQSPLQHSEADGPNTTSSSGVQRIRQHHPGKNFQPDNSLWRTILISSIVTSLVLGTLGFNYLTNPNKTASPIKIISDSFTFQPGSAQETSLGIAGLLLITWVVLSLVLNLESIDQISRKKSWLGFLATMGISIGISVAFWVWQTSRLATIFTLEARTVDEVQRQVANYANLLSWYYLFVLVLLLVSGRFFPLNWPAKPAYNRVSGIVVGVVTTILVAYLAVTTNLRIIQADITFKLADSFVNSQQWPGAIFIYQEAIRRSPNEDHYYLFLGRAYLEYARTIENQAERDEVMAQAEKDLLTAQALNPLNTDHTANLARLYGWRGSVSTARKNEDLARARNLYETALTLSPNNATLWTELAILNLNAFENLDEARKAAENAKKLDDQYDRAYAVLGDYYVQSARQATDGSEQNRLLSAAIKEYLGAIQSTPNIPQNFPVLYTYYAALGNVYYESLDLQEAAETYESSFQFSSEANRWRVAETIAQIYLEARDASRASAWLQIAQQSAPESAQDRIDELKTEIEKLP